MDNLVAYTKTTGGVGVVGMFVPQDPGAENELAKQGKMAFNFGAFWFQGQQIRTGQANVKHYNRRLAELIHYGRAKPEQIISHRLKLADGPTLTSTSMRAITAGPKLCLNQRLEFACVGLHASRRASLTMEAGSRTRACPQPDYSQKKRTHCAVFKSTLKWLRINKPQERLR
jgi:hypothetical protein